MGRSKKVSTPPRQVISLKPTKTLRWIDHIHPKEVKEGGTKASSLVIPKPPQQPLHWAPPGGPNNRNGPFFMGFTNTKAEDTASQLPDLPEEADSMASVPGRQFQNEDMWPQLSPQWGTGPISIRPEGSNLLTRTFQRREARPRPPNWGRWPPMSFLLPCMDGMPFLGNRMHF